MPAVKAGLAAFTASHGAVYDRVHRDAHLGFESLSAGEVSGCLHFLQSTRTSRWASTASSDEAQGKAPRPYHQPGERAGRIVRVQSREHQMARQRSLDGYLRSFLVPNFADENDVRVMPQNRTQATRKSEPRFSDTWI